MKDFGTSLLILTGFLFLCNSQVQGQFYNKEIGARILVEQTSEFYTFKAIAENKTPSGYSLTYEFSLFRHDAKGNVSKSSQSNRFVLPARQQKILAETSINYNEEGKIILLLMIYDKDGKPLGKDRIELQRGGRTALISIPLEKPNKLNTDQAQPADGFVLNGLVTQKTITKAGRDFYRYFYSEYYNMGIKTPYNIKIEEVPGRGFVTRVSVFVEDSLVWQFFAQPRKEFLEKNAKVALQRTIAQIQRLEQQKTEFIQY